MQTSCVGAAAALTAWLGGHGSAVAPNVVQCAPVAWQTPVLVSAVGASAACRASLYTFPVAFTAAGGAVNTSAVFTSQV